MSRAIRATDALGREITLAGPPARIVSLVPSLTELLAELGLDSEVVGLTTFCVRPPGWRESKTRVGGTKQVRLDRVRELTPDLVLANKEENTEADVAALAESVPVYVTDIATVPEALDAIRAIGELTARGRLATELAARIQRDFDGLGDLPSRRAAYLIWREPYMTVGQDTFIHDVMSRGGLSNVFSGRTRYPQISAAELRAAEPELILLSSEPFPFKEQHLAELREAVPGATPLLVDGELFSWYGSRLLHTPDYLRSLGS